MTDDSLLYFYGSENSTG